MNIDLMRVSGIVGGSIRFTDPSADGSGYYIFSDDSGIRAEYILLYYEKLGYAVENADMLISEGFREEFFGFYGVDREKAVSPEIMRNRLIFDSFVLVPSKKTIECCVSNPEFMFGHFIEYVWDYDWNLYSVRIN